MPCQLPAPKEMTPRSRHRQKKLNLPIFRDSTSDNAITYDDWRCDVDNCIREGHSTTLIRDSVLSTLEGRPHHTAMTAMEDGDGSLKSIMTALDQVYGGATTYTTLLHKLNSIQQAHSELAKDYYKCIMQTWVKLQEFHRYMFRPVDLEHQAKEAFFNGLRPEFQSMVVHKRDDPSVSIMKLLVAIRECKENQENNGQTRQAEYAKAYPPSTTRNDYHDRDQNNQSNAVPQNQGSSHYHQDNWNVLVTVHTMHPEPEVHMQVNDDYLPPYVDYDNPDELEQGDPELTLYTQFYKATVQLADNAERRDGHCHNCKETGHFWREYQQPLREEFKCLMDRTRQHQGELNKNGGHRAKGG